MVVSSKRSRLKFVCLSALCLMAVALIGGIAEGQKEGKSDITNVYKNAFNENTIVFEKIRTQIIPDKVKKYDISIEEKIKRFEQLTALKDVSNEEYKISVLVYIWPDYIKSAIKNNQTFNEVIKGIAGNLKLKGFEVVDDRVNPLVIEINSLHELDALSDLHFVSYIRDMEFLTGHISDPTTIASAEESSVLSEGVYTINAPSVWSKGFQGEGIKVGVLDAGFSGWKNLKSQKELPENTFLFNDSTGEMGEVHGSACAELIYDVAPKISGLYLSSYGSYELIDRYNAINWFRDNGVKVISHSVNNFGWLPQLPTYLDSDSDGNGEFWDVYKLIEYAISNNMSWVNAAGNSRIQHWEGYWHDNDNDDVLDIYKDGKYSDYIEYDREAIQVRLIGGIEFNAWIRWDDYPYPSSGPSNDFDVYLYCWSGNGWDLVDYSSNNQNGSFGQEPLEFLSYTPPGSDYYDCELFIKKWNASNANSIHFDVWWEGNFGYWYYKDESYKAVVESGSIEPPADHPQVIAVGAVPWANTSDLEFFSSIGPAYNPYLGVNGLTKPDLVAPDRVSTVSYGNEGFAGTSAATPHVAGVVALILSANSSLKPSNIKQILEGTADDLGISGKDDYFGAGLVNASNAINEVIRYSLPDSSAIVSADGNIIIRLLDIRDEQLNTIKYNFGDVMKIKVVWINSSQSGYLYLKDAGNNNSLIEKYILPDNVGGVETISISSNTYSPATNFTIHVEIGESVLNTSDDTTLIGDSWIIKAEPIDNNPPIVNITSPLNGTVVRSPVINITGYISDDSGIKAVCYGHSVLGSKGSPGYGGDGCGEGQPPYPKYIPVNWTVDDLGIGINIFTISAIDVANNSGNASVTIIYRTTNYVPDDYEEIQWAINNATQGDTIIVRDGIYTENIKINKSITLKSENGSANCIIQAENPNEDVINITADYVNISGFTVKGADENLKAGIHVLGANHCNISNNNISNNVFGIQIRNSSDNVLRNNSMQNNTYSFGVSGLNREDYLQDVDTSNTVDGKPVYYLVNVSDLVFNSANAGYVAVINGYNITVKDLVLSGNRDGVILVNTHTSLVENITATDSWHGIFIAYSEDNVVAGNNISDNRWGISILNSTSNVISDNRLKNNTGFDLESGYPPSSGIVISGSGNTLRSNNLSDNFVGISFLSKILNVDTPTIDNTLTFNNLSDNTYGVYIYNCSSNRIYLNNFLNAENVYSLNSTNTWNSSYMTYQFNNSSFKGFLGNFWKDYSGTDTDGDGIGEVAYNISSDKDYYPLMELFENYKLPRTYNITGKVYYDGEKTGEILIMAFSQMPDGNVSPFSTVTIPSPEEFVFEFPNGTYYLEAYMDNNSNDELDVNEPAGYAVNRSFDEEPDAIKVNGSDVSGIDITLFEDELLPALTLNISSLYTLLNFNGTDYEPNSTIISFEIEDNTLIENATLEIINDNVTSYYYEIGNRSYSNFTEFYLEEPDTFTARLSAFDVWGNHNSTEVLFYGLGRNQTTIENITEVNLTVAENMSIELEGENGTASLNFEETTTCDVFNITEMVAYRYLNLSGKITNISVLELKIECGGVIPIIFMWDKAESEWINVSAMDCIDTQDNLIVVNVSRLAEIRGMSLSDFLNDPILALSIAPDLVVENIDAPSNMVSGNNYEIKVIFANTGNQNATFNITLEANGNEIGRSQSSLAAGSSDKEIFKWRPSAGTYELAAKVDPENAVIELNESNNERTISIKVNQPTQEEQPPRRGGGGGSPIPLPPTPTPTPKPLVTTKPATISAVPLKTPTPTPTPTPTVTPILPPPTPEKTPEPGTPITAYILLIAVVIGAVITALYFAKRK